MERNDLIERLSAAETDRRAFEKAYGATSNLPWREGGAIKPADMYIMRQGKMYNTHLLSAAWIGWQLARAADATTIATLSEALAEAEKKGAETRAERDGVLYAFHHRLFSEVGLSYPNDGVSVCTGLKLDALAAAKTLREMGLVTIRNSGAGPLVTWADGRGLPAPPRDLSQGGQHG